MNGPPVNLVSSDECSICQAVHNISAASSTVLVQPDASGEIARAHFIVAFIIGFRRDRLDACLSCKGIVDRSAAMIEQRGRSNGRVIL